MEDMDWVPDGWYWSLGTHEQWKYDCRIWLRVKPFGVKIFIGIGNTLQDSIQDCKRKYYDSID